MTQKFRWLEEQAKCLEVVSRMFEKFGVDNVHNLERKVYKLAEDLEKEKLSSSEYLTLTQTQDHGAAKKRVRSLMDEKDAKKAPTTSPLEAFAEKYSLDISFLQGIGNCWDTQAEGRDQIKMFANLEKKIDHQRKIVTEAYIFFMVKVEEAATEAEFSEEKTAAEVREWHEALQTDFHDLDASEFWQEYKGKLTGVQLIQPESTEVPLFEAKKYCEDYYPALLLSQTFSNPESLGTVSLALMERWGELYAKYEPITDPKEKRQKMFSLARVVMKKAVYRNVEGNKSIPTIKEDNFLEQLLTLEEYNPYDKPNEINENTQLDDILIEFISLSC
jgi:hypothetical protein